MAAPTRTLVQKLAVDIREGKVNPAAEIERAWTADDAESVATYALAAAVAGAPLPAAKVLDAVVLLDDLLLGAMLAANVTGDCVKALLDAVERDATADERDALALYLAAKLCLRAPPPPRLPALVRTHARRGGSQACGELLVATSSVLADAEVSAVVASAFADIGEREALEAVASLLRGADGPIVEALPDYAPASLAAPLPVRRTGDKPGRNDPCPCGSGKKYKKCCQDKDSAASSADPEAAWRKQLDAAVPTMTAQQAVDLRLADLAALPYERLLPETRLAAMRELLRHRRWDAAERAIDAMAKAGEDANKARLELVDEAFRMREVDVARAHAQRLREAGVADGLLEAMDAVATPAQDSLSRLDELAGKGLRDVPASLFDVADALLTYHPSLGIVTARGVLATAHPDDAKLFLELIEEARDRLGLPPGDAALDVQEALERLDRERDTKPPADGQTVEALATEARALRAAAREASARIEELEARLRERTREAREVGAPQVPAPSSWESERADLRDRLAELKSLIAEGNDERAELRRKLAEAAGRLEEKAVAGGPTGVPVAEGAPDPERTPDEAPRVRGVMVPHFDRAAEAALRDLPARVVRDALRVIADLCSGEGNVWREIKQLERISPPMYSARIGIHYRVLFRMEPGVLDVAEILAREGLLAGVRRHWR
jgi:hypothetical protein